MSCDLVESYYVLKEFISIVSTLCALILAWSFRVSSRWTLELRDSKRMLLFLSIFNAAASLSFALKPSSQASAECSIQASLVQFFQVGATFYDAFLAIETKILIDRALRGETGRKEENENLSWVNPRHLFFHFLVWSYGIATVIVLNAGNGIIGYYDRLRVEMSAKSKVMIARFLIIPIVNIVLWLPTVISRVGSYKTTALRVAWVVMFPLAGLCNCCIFIFSDKELIKEWILYLQGKKNTNDDRDSSSGSMSFSEATDFHTNRVSAFEQNLWADNRLSRLSHLRQSHLTHSSTGSAEAKRSEHLNHRGSAIGVVKTKKDERPIQSSAVKLQSSERALELAADCDKHALGVAAADITLHVADGAEAVIEASRDFPVATNDASPSPLHVSSVQATLNPLSTARGGEEEEEFQRCKRGGEHEGVARPEAAVHGEVRSSPGGEWEPLEKAPMVSADGGQLKDCKNDHVAVSVQLDDIGEVDANIHFKKLAGAGMDERSTLERTTSETIFSDEFNDTLQSQF